MDEDVLPSETRANFGQAVKNFFNVNRIEKSTVTEIVTVSRPFTTKTVFIMNCTPMPFSAYPVCPKGEKSRQIESKWSIFFVPVVNYWNETSIRWLYLNSLWFAIDVWLWVNSKRWYVDVKDIKDAKLVWIYMWKVKPLSTHESNLLVSSKVQWTYYIQTKYFRWERV